MQTTHQSIPKTIALATLIAGTLDISDALIFYGLRGVSSLLILQSIASALLGRSAYAGGLKTATLGLLIHFCITLFWATLFVLAATRFRALRRHALLSGLAYGMVVYLIMNYIALPLTRLAPVHHPTGISLINAVAALMLCIGLPIALINRRFAPPSRVSS